MSAALDFASRLEAMERRLNSQENDINELKTEIHKQRRTISEQAGELDVWRAEVELLQGAVYGKTRWKNTAWESRKTEAARARPQAGGLSQRGVWTLEVSERGRQEGRRRAR